VARRIPIQNLYYLLCYAWDVLEERDDTLVSELEGLSHAELLAKVLSVSVQRLWKRGLDRGYRTIADDVRSPRGRLDIPRTIARQLEPLGLAACSFAKLGHDVLHNQILVTTARRLSRLPQLHRDLRAAMIAIDRTLADVSTIPVRSSTFSQVQLHGRLRRYRLPLHVCQLIHDQLVVDEATGEVRFLDYLRNLAAAAAGSDASAAGVLLYPEVRPLPTLQYQHGPHRLTATGVDLTQDWRAIHQRLLDIVASA
jgi:5-methylcytosine-specific restriction enzyme subunit McrC